MTSSSTLITCAFALDCIIGRGQVVDAYYGDETPDESVVSTYTIESISEVLSDLEKHLDATDSAYHAHLATIHALRAHIRLHTGDRGVYAELFETTYSHPLTLARAESIHDRRERMISILARLGYHDPFPRSLQRWRDDSLVSAREYRIIIDQTRTDVEPYIFDTFLPSVVGVDTTDFIREHSGLSIEVVDTTAPWSAYHFYRGGYQSIITINSSRKLNRHSRGLLLCHEALPGHHLEAVIREKFYRDGHLDSIATLNLLCSERSLMSEGWGDYGIHFMEHLFDEEAILGFLDKKLSTDIVHNTALAMIRGEIDEASAIETIMQGAGSDRDRAIASLRFTREWFLYFPVYSIGYDLVREYLTGHDPLCLKFLYLADSLHDLK